MGRVLFGFRDEGLRQAYSLSRYRRNLSVPTQHQSDLLFEHHLDILQPLMDFVASRGWMLDDTELLETVALRKVLGSIQ